MTTKNKGFTIIELMVVVAIIGILVTLAIPAYLSFISKSRRTEVKYNLEGIYKAQTSWFGEHNTFSNSFNTIRWRPDGICQYTYYMGAEYFGKDLAANPDPGIIVPGSSGNTFTAKAWGNIDNDPTIDVWHINELKNLANDVDDMGS